MIARILLAAAAISTLLAGTAAAQEALVTYKSLSPELALDLARATLADCQKRGFQVTVAVVDRFGVTQVLLRDRFAGPHTVSTASGKAWTAASFRTSTTELNAISQPGMMQAGIRHLPGAVIVGGGLTVEAGGSLLGPSASPEPPAATRTRPAPRRASTPYATSSISRPVPPDQPSRLTRSYSFAALSQLMASMKAST